MVNFNPKDHVNLCFIPRIEAVEKKFNSVYIGQFELFSIDGELIADTCRDYFYDPNPDTEKGHSNYFCVRFTGGTNINISNGINIASKTLVCVQSTEGELLYSHYLHDFRESKNGSVWIDGGFHYTRTNSQHLVYFRLQQDKWVKE